MPAVQRLIKFEAFHPNASYSICKSSPPLSVLMFWRRSKVIFPWLLIRRHKVFMCPKHFSAGEAITQPVAVLDLNLSLSMFLWNIKMWQ